MEFRRTGQRGDRRRRVMLDERVGSSDTLEPILTERADRDDETPSPLNVRTYHEAASAEWQRRITDLIPTRCGTVLLLFLVGIAGIVGIEVLYGQSETWRARFGDASVAALDPVRPASLAGWFSSFLMVVSCITALMIYSIRRHKEDDYRGRYRVWVWAAIVWLLGSMAAAAPMHRLVAAVVADVTGSQLVGSPAIFSTAFYAMILSTVIVPVVVDMRHSRMALLTVFVAGACYATAAAIDLGLLLPLVGPFQTICLSAARMGSHLFLLTSLLLFARHVFLEAQGKITVRPARPKREKAAVQRRRRKKQPELRVVSDDLGDTVDTMARRTESAARRKKKNKSGAGRNSETTGSRRRIKSKSLRSSVSSSSPASSRSETAEPRTVKVPTIRRQNSSTQQGEHDEEIARLEAIEPHLLTKAQRRRLRKLKRRHERKAA